MSNQKHFRVGQKLLLFNSEKKVLIIHFSSTDRITACLHGKWDFPGGGVEWNESLEKGIEREIKEELGQVKFKLGDPILVWDWVHEENSDKRTVCVLYEAEYLGGKIILNEEHDRYEWVEIDKLMNYDWHEDDLVAVRKIMNKYSVSSSSRVKLDIGDLI